MEHNYNKYRNSKISTKVDNSKFKVNKSEEKRRKKKEKADRNIRFMSLIKDHRQKSVIENKSFDVMRKKRLKEEKENEPARPTIQSFGSKNKKRLINILRNSKFMELRNKEARKRSTLKKDTVIYNLFEKTKRWKKSGYNICLRKKSFFNTLQNNRKTGILRINITESK